MRTPSSSSSLHAIESTAMQPINEKSRHVEVDHDDVTKTVEEETLSSLESNIRKVGMSLE